MTKKDYIAVAKILASHRNNIPTDHFNDLVADFCAMFKANNARFDDMRFCNAAKNEWSGSPDPRDPDNYWIDDETGKRVKAGQ